VKAKGSGISTKPGLRGVGLRVCCTLQAEFALAEAAAAGMVWCAALWDVARVMQKQRHHAAPGLRGFSVCECCALHAALLLRVRCEG
jgi:hypothetical protein